MFAHILTLWSSGAAYVTSHHPLQDVQDADVVDGDEGGEVRWDVDPLQCGSRRIESLKGFAFLYIPPLAIRQKERRWLNAFNWKHCAHIQLAQLWPQSKRIWFRTRAKTERRLVNLTTLFYQIQTHTHTHSHPQAPSNTDRHTHHPTTSFPEWFCLISL